MENNKAFDLQLALEAYKDGLSQIDHIEKSAFRYLAFFVVMFSVLGFLIPHLDVANMKPSWEKGILSSAWYVYFFYFIFLILLTGIFLKPPKINQLSNLEDLAHKHPSAFLDKLTRATQKNNSIIKGKNKRLSGLHWILMTAIFSFCIFVYTGSDKLAIGTKRTTSAVKLQKIFHGTSGNAYSCSDEQEPGVCCFVFFHQINPKQWNKNKNKKINRIAQQFHVEHLFRCIIEGTNMCIEPKIDFDTRDKKYRNQPN